MLNQLKQMTFCFWWNNRKFSWGKLSDLPPTMNGKGQRKFSILATLKSLIWHSLGLFLHQTKQSKHNLTNLNYVYQYFSITYVWPQLKTTFSDLIQQKKILKEIWGCTQKTEISVSSRKMSSMKTPHS